MACVILPSLCFFLSFLYYYSLDGKPHPQPSDHLCFYQILKAIAKEKTKAKTNVFNVCCGPNVVITLLSSIARASIFQACVWLLWPSG